MGLAAYGAVVLCRRQPSDVKFAHSLSRLRSTYALGQPRKIKAAHDIGKSLSAPPEHRCRVFAHYAEIGVNGYLNAVYGQYLTVWCEHRQSGR